MGLEWASREYNGRVGSSHSASHHIVSEAAGRVRENIFLSSHVFGFDAIFIPRPDKQLIYLSMAGILLGFGWCLWRHEFSAVRLARGANGLLSPN